MSLPRTTLPWAVMVELPRTSTVAWYSRSSAECRKPVSLPASLMSLVTRAPSATAPVQPETPVSLPAALSRPV